MGLRLLLYALIPQFFAILTAHPKNSKINSGNSPFMASQSFTQVTPHIARLELSAAAVFLVKGDEGWTMVDTGPEKETDKVMKAVLDYTKSAQPRVLILTHGHPDHAGGALKIRGAWWPKIAAGRAEVPYLTEPVFYRKIAGRSLQNYMAGLTIGPALLGKGVHLPLDEGNIVSGMTVYHVPGHTPGMIALLHHADRALLCSDAFANRGKLADPAAAMTYDMKLAHKSQKKLAALNFDHLLPSQGGPIMNDGKRQAMELVEKHFGKGAFAADGKAVAAH